jgi:hypothetical protein
MHCATFHVFASMGAIPTGGSADQTNMDKALHQKVQPDNSLCLILTQSYRGDIKGWADKRFLTK